MGWGEFVIWAIGVPLIGLWFLCVAAFASDHIVHGDDPDWELTCPTCGRPVKAGQTLCFRCGQELPVAARSRKR